MLLLLLLFTANVFVRGGSGVNDINTIWRHTIGPEIQMRPPHSWDIPAFHVFLLGTGNCCDTAVCLEIKVFQGLDYDNAPILEFDYV